VATSRAGGHGAEWQAGKIAGNGIVTQDEETASTICSSGERHMNCGRGVTPR
jgi:hypothetical protein